MKTVALYRYKFASRALAAAVWVERAGATVASTESVVAEAMVADLEVVQVSKVGEVGGVEGLRAQVERKEPEEE